METLLIWSMVAAVAIVLTLRVGNWIQSTGVRPKRRERSRAQLAYEADPEATASCVHLQPIERAMRRAGVKMELFEGNEYQPAIRAACRIHETELRRVFALPESVTYREGYEPDRTPNDIPRADIFCGECMYTNRAQSDILVLHPDGCDVKTPWFPSAPPGS